MTDLVLLSQPTLALSPADERVIAAAELAELRRNPRVIDGEVAGSWFPRPIWPVLATSGALLALGVARLIQEVVR